VERQGSQQNHPFTSKVINKENNSKANATRQNEDAQKEDMVYARSPRAEGEKKERTSKSHQVRHISQKKKAKCIRDNLSTFGSGPRIMSRMFYKKTKSNRHGRLQEGHRSSQVRHAKLQEQC
jgi:hypothetical protein